MKRGRGTRPIFTGGCHLTNDYDRFSAAATAVVTVAVVAAAIVAAAIVAASVVSAAGKQDDDQDDPQAVIVVVKAHTKDSPHLSCSALSYAQKTKMGHDHRKKLISHQ